MNNIIWRTSGNYLHILNLNSGRIQSFNTADGHKIIDCLSYPDKLKELVDEDTFNFFHNKKSKVKPKQLRSALLELGTEFSFPTIVNIEINRRCILRCKHCYISTKDLGNHNQEYFDQISPKEIKKFFTSLKELGVFLVVITGGEPFINKNIEIIINEANEQGFIIEIFTNLQYLPNWLLDSEKNKFRINRFQTSIYSIIDRIHDSVTGKNGSLQTTLDNIKLLQNKGYITEVATPLMSINFNSRNKTSEYFFKKKITHDFAWPIFNEYYTTNKGKSNLNISKDQFLTFCMEYPNFLLTPNFKGKECICSAGRSMFSISATGEMFPCSQFPKRIGNIQNSSINNIYHSKEMEEIRNVSPDSIPDKTTLQNFCMGNNYSETKDPMNVSNFLREMYDYYSNNKKRKEVKNN